MICDPHQQSWKFVDRLLIFNCSHNGRETVLPHEGEME